MKTKNLKQEQHRDRFKKAGLVQVNAWIPASEKHAVLEHCAKLRREYLRRIAFDKNFGGEDE